MYVHLYTAEYFSTGECAYAQTDLLLFLNTLPPPHPGFAVVTEKSSQMHFTTSQLVILGYIQALLLS